ncbi:MAG: MaoC family dehydratase [Alphaproteobacteria bacterium]
MAEVSGDAINGDAGGMEELDGYAFEELRVGMTAVYSKTVTESDINLFCAISGDTNPLHLDYEYAKSSMFGGPIAHGMLAVSFISTVIGTKLPGPGCIYVSQNCKFKAPVRAGDTVRARATITELFPERRRVALRTICTVGETVVVEGDAVVMLPRTRGNGAGA